MDLWNTAAVRVDTEYVEQRFESGPRRGVGLGLFGGRHQWSDKADKPSQSKPFPLSAAFPSFFFLFTFVLLPVSTGLSHITVSPSCSAPPPGSPGQIGRSLLTLSLHTPYILVTYLSMRFFGAQRHVSAIIGNARRISF